MLDHISGAAIGTRAIALVPWPSAQDTFRSPIIRPHYSGHYSRLSAPVAVRSEQLADDLIEQAQFCEHIQNRVAGADQLRLEVGLPESFHVDPDLFWMIRRTSDAEPVRHLLWPE